MKLLVSLIALLFFFLQSPSLTLAQYTSSYTDSYTGGYTSGYEGGYTSGYEGNYTGGYEGCYGSCGGLNSVSGFVYNDKDQNATYGSGDVGISSTTFGETVTVQVIRPAYTDPAYCVVTGTDENGNPTGETCYPAVNHPDQVVASGNTDVGGHYSVSSGGIGAGTYKIHHTKNPLWPGWVRTTPNDVTATFFSASGTNRFASFGVYTPSFAQNVPQSGPCVGANPNIHISWGAVTGAPPAGYRIYYLKSTDPGGTTPVQTGTLPLSPTTYDFKPSTINLIPGTQYTFLVVAVNGSGTPLVYSDSQVWSHTKFGAYTTYPTCTTALTGKVYQDVNTNGVFDAGVDTPANGAPMQLIFPVGGPVVANTNTVSGDYTFSNITPGSYQVKHNTLPGGVSRYIPPTDTITVNMNSNQVQNFSYVNSNPPIVGFYITKPPSPTQYPAGPIIIDANQNSSITLNWSISNATSATRTSTPDQGIWDTPISLSGGASSGSVAIPTTNTGIFNFTLTVTNAAFPNNPPFTVSLRINQYPPAFFKTTGGDVHTNESIYITPP